MFKRKSILVVAGIGAFAAIMGFASPGGSTEVSTNGYVPIIIEQASGSNAPNSNNSYRIDLSGAPDSDQPIAITCTSSSAYTNLPSTVTVLAGQASVTFNATVTANPAACWSITATSNGGSATKGIIVPPPSMATW